MHLFHNRPLSAACCIFAGCALLISILNKHLSALLLAVGVLLAVVFLVAFLRTRRNNALLGFICALAAAVAILDSFSYFHVRYPKHQAYVGRECTVEGVVLERTGDTAYSTDLYVQIESVDGKRMRFDATLECQYVSSLQVGERFCAKVRGRAFETVDDYDEEVASLGDGKTVAFVCDDYRNCEILEGESRSLRVLFSKWNAAASFRLEQAVGGREGALCSALFLGNRERLNADETLAFERAGVSHLLALSGMHISILIMLAEGLLHKCCCPKAARMLVVSVLAILYLFLTGASLSTARAVCMLCILTLTYCMQENYDSFTALCVSLAFLILLMPYSVLDIGMWMSFIAAGAIIIFSPVFMAFSKRISEKLPMPRMLHKLLVGVLGALFVGVVANLALALVQALVFGKLSLISVPATMLLSIPLKLALLLSALTVLFLPIGGVTHAVASLISEWTYRLSDMRGVLIPLNDAFTQAVLWLLAAALIFLAVANLKKPFWSILPVALAAIAILCSFTVTHTAYGKRQTMHVSTSKGEMLLVTEAGDAVAVTYESETANSAFLLAKHLQNRRCTELEDLVIMHYYNQSAYFLATLAGEVKVRNLRLPPPSNEAEEGIAMRLTEEAERRGIKVLFHLDNLSVESPSLSNIPWN